MAIIKKFNKALENLNKDPNLPSEPSSDDDEQANEELTESQVESQKQRSELEKGSDYESIAKDVREQLELELKGKLDPQLEDFERLSERAKKSMPIELGETEAEKLAMLTEKSLDDIAINDRQPPGVSEHVAHESTKHKPSQSSV